MQTWKTRFRRIAAMVCALALCASLLPAGALANNTDSIDVDESSSSQVVTGTEPTEEEKTEETASETEQPAAETEQPAEETETEEKVEEETEEPAEEPEEEPAETVGDGTDETSEKTVTVEQEPEVTDEEPAVTDEPETEEEAVQTARNAAPMNEGETDNTANQSIVLNDGQYITVNDSDGDGHIETSIGTIIYDTETTEDPEGGLNPYYKISVELYVNGQLEVKTDALTLNNRRHGALFIEPAAGYYYHTLGEDTTNAYTFQMDGTTNHSWDDLTGYLDINGGSPNGTDNVLQIRLWTFEAWSTLTVRKGLINDNDDVTGYQISFEAINPVTNAREIFTYDATAFGVAERQIVPNNTRVTLTGVCNPYYEIAEWDKALEASNLCDFNGDEGRNGTGSVYGNTVTLDLNYINNNGRPVNEIVIRGQKAVSAPSEDKVKDILTDIGENLVKVDCVGTSDHAAVTYGLLDGGWSYDVNQTLGGDSVSDYTVTVTIDADTYLAKYNEGNADHTLAENEGDKTITLRYVAGQWTAEGYPVTIKVTCGEVEVPTKPDEPTVEGLLVENAVKIQCTNDEATHDDQEKVYGLLNNTYTIGEVKGSVDAGYTVQVTINDVDPYVTQFNTDTGVEHTLSPETQPDRVITLKWDAENKEWKVGEDAPVTYTVICENGSDEPGGEEPEKPDDTEIKALLDVKVTCANNVSTHQEEIYEVDSYTIGDVTSNDNGTTYTCIVTIPSAGYIEKFNTNSGMRHTCATVSEEVTLEATQVDNVWKWQLGNGEESPVEFQATCKPDAPTPEEVDKLNLKGVALVDCQNTSADHEMETYGLLKDSYTIGEVYLADDNTYKVNLTLSPDKYVSAYDNATGAVHTGANAGVITLKYADGAWQLDGNGMVMFQVKCSTVTVPGDGGNNNDTPKDEHPDIAEGMANGTWGGTPTPTPAASATSTIPQTSDSMPIGLLAGTAAIAAAAIALLLVLRKRRQQ